MNAIPTFYNNVQFRSRLEAKWAAYFDLENIEWEYEPIDLIGYIPDFLVKINRNKVLVEVKPITNNAAPVDDHITKILKSGWTGDFVIAGASLDCVWHNVGGPIIPLNLTTWRLAGNTVQWNAPLQRKPNLFRVTYHTPTIQQDEIPIPQDRYVICYGCGVIDALCVCQGLNT